MRNLNYLVSLVASVALAASVFSTPSVAAPPSMTPLPMKVVAGEYVRQIKGQPGKLSVKAVGKDKVDVLLEASKELPKPASGKIQNIAPITKNIVVLTNKSKSGEYSISMRFTGTAVILVYTGTGFGGTGVGGGVDPSGVYVKQDALAKPAK